MFCPKCGKELPDGSAFCGGCGNKLQTAPVSNATTPNSFVSKSVSSNSVVRKLGTAGIAAVIFAAIAFIVSLLPWFETSSTLLGVSNTLSGVGSFLGMSTAGYTFESEYSVWNIIGLAGSFEDYVSTFASYGGSKAAGALMAVTLFSWACFLLWLAGAICIVWGVASAFIKGRLGMVRVGSIFMMISAAVFLVFAYLLGSSTGETTMMPGFCLVCSILALMLSLIAIGVSKDVSNSAASTTPKNDLAQ